MSEKEKAKEILREVRDDMMDFREILGFPALRRPVLQLREQMKFISQMSQVRPQLQSGQPQPTDEEVRRQPPTRRETLPQLPQLPLPLGLKNRIERFRAMPIRRGIGEVLNSYSRYISSPRRRKHPEDEEPYEERQRELAKMAQARLRRKGIYKEHGIEM